MGYMQYYNVYLSLISFLWSTIMPFSITTKQITSGTSNTYSVGFRNLIEDHIQYLQTSPYTRSIALKGMDEYRFTGDFYALLQVNNIDQDMWWVVMRINNLHSPIDYAGDLKSILVPDRDRVLAILQKYMNTETVY